MNRHTNKYMCKKYVYICEREHITNSQCRTIRHAQYSSTTAYVVHQYYGMCDTTLLLACVVQHYFRHVRYNTTFGMCGTALLLACTVQHYWHVWYNTTMTCAVQHYYDMCGTVKHGSTVQLLMKYTACTACVTRQYNECVYI